MGTSTEIKNVAAKYATGSEAKEKMEADFQGADSTIDDASWVTGSITDSFISGLDRATEAWQVEGDVTLLSHAAAGSPNDSYERPQNGNDPLAHPLPPSEILSGLAQKVAQRAKTLAVAETNIKAAYGLDPVDDGSFAADVYDLALAFELQASAGPGHEWDLDRLNETLGSFSSRLETGKPTTGQLSDALDVIKGVMGSVHEEAVGYGEAAAQESHHPGSKLLEDTASHLSTLEDELVKLGDVVSQKRSTVAEAELAPLQEACSKAVAALADGVLATQTADERPEPTSHSFPGFFYEVQLDGVPARIDLDEPAGTIYLETPEYPPQYHPVKVDPKLIQDVIDALGARGDFFEANPWFVK